MIRILVFGLLLLAACKEEPPPAPIVEEVPEPEPEKFPLSASVLQPGTDVFRLIETGRCFTIGESDLHFCSSTEKPKPKTKKKSRSRRIRGKAPESHTRLHPHKVITLVKGNEAHVSFASARSTTKSLGIHAKYQVQDREHNNSFRMDENRGTLKCDGNTYALTRAETSAAELLRDKDIFVPSNATFTADLWRSATDDIVALLEYVDEYGDNKPLIRVRTDSKWSNFRASFVGKLTFEAMSGEKLTILPKETDSPHTATWKTEDASVDLFPLAPGKRDSVIAELAPVSDPISRTPCAILFNVKKQP